MTATKLWNFSIHASSRSASRLHLLIDEKAKIEISKQLDTAATLVQKSHGKHLFEISIFGARTIAVVNLLERTVVTLISAKNWYRRIKGGVGRHVRPKPSWKKKRDADPDQEETG